MASTVEQSKLSMTNGLSKASKTLNVKRSMYRCSDKIGKRHCWHYSERLSKLSKQHASTRIELLQTGGHHLTNVSEFEQVNSYVHDLILFTTLDGSIQTETVKEQVRH